VKSILNSGTDPDPRFTLANERTFLAWIRTSMALILGAIVVASLLPSVDFFSNLASPIAVVLGLLGASLALWAWFRWRKTELALRLGKSLPLSRVLIALAITVAIMGLSMIAVGIELVIGA
jgi:putative membrane protein